MKTKKLLEYLESLPDGKNQQLTKIYFSLLGNPQKPKDIRFNAPLLTGSAEDIAKWQKKKAEYDNLKKIIDDYTTYQKRKTSGEEYNFRQDLKKLRCDLNKLISGKSGVTYSHTTYRPLIGELVESKFIIKSKRNKDKIEANIDILHTFLRKYTLTEHEFEAAREELEELICSEEFKKEVTGYLVSPGSMDFVDAIYYLMLRSRPLLKAKKLFTLERVGKYFFNGVFMMNQMWRGGWFLDQNFDSESFRSKVGDLIIQDMLFLSLPPHEISPPSDTSKEVREVLISMRKESLKALFRVLSTSDIEEGVKGLYEIAGYIETIDNHLLKRCVPVLEGNRLNTLIDRIHIEYGKNARYFLREFIKYCEKQGEKVNPKIKKGISK